MLTAILRGDWHAKLETAIIIDEPCRRPSPAFKLSCHPLLAKPDPQPRHYLEGRMTGLPSGPLHSSSLDTPSPAASERADQPADAEGRCQRTREGQVGEVEQGTPRPQPSSLSKLVKPPPLAFRPVTAESLHLNCLLPPTHAPRRSRRSRREGDAALLPA